MTVKARALSPESGKPIKSISLMGSAEPVKWKQRADRLEIVVPKRIPSEHAIGFKVRF